MQGVFLRPFGRLIESKELTDYGWPAVVQPYENRAPLLIPFGIGEVEYGRFVQLQQRLRLSGLNHIAASVVEQIGQLGLLVRLRYCLFILGSPGRRTGYGTNNPN